MSTLDTLSVGLSAAVTAAILSAVCAVAFVAWPDATIDFFNSWMHGLDLNKARSTAPITIGRVVYGVIGIALLAFVAGVVFATVHNSLSRGEGS